MTTFGVDTFTGADNTTLASHTPETGGSWSALSGSASTFRISSNQAAPVSSTALIGYVLSATPPSADYSVQVDIATAGLTSTTNAGVALRAVDGNNLYWGTIIKSTGIYSIYKVVGGVYTQVATGSALGTLPAAVTLKLSASGTTLTLYANGTQVAQATGQTDFASAGKAGFFGSNWGTASLDNFSAYTGVSSLTINPDDAAWDTSPYNHVLSGSGASSVDSSANVGWYKRIRYSASGTAALTFAAANSNAIIGVRFDGVGAWTKYAAATSIVLSPPASRTAYRLLEICYLTQLDTQDLWTGGPPPTGAIQFTGLGLDSGATVAAPAAKTRNVLVYGDSVSWGAWALVNTGNELTDCDVTTAYSWGLQTALNANVGIVAFSGQKLTGAGLGVGSHVPALTTSYNAQWSGLARSFSPVPDLVVIAIGRNDGAGNNATYQTALGALVDGLTAAGVAAGRILIVSDLDQYHASDNATVAAAKGCVTVTIPFSASLDSSDSVHPFADFHQTQYLPAVTAAANTIFGASGGTSEGSQSDKFAAAAAAAAAELAGMAQVSVTTRLPFGCGNPHTVFYKGFPQYVQLGTTQTVPQFVADQLQAEGLRTA